MTKRNRWVLGGLLALAVLSVTVAVSVAWSPSLRYRVTGRQEAFNLVVSRAVPRRAPLARLEAVAGPGRRIPFPHWLRQTIRRQPDSYRDGWLETDTCVSYSFPGNSTWYFQVRDDRLVNYDPSVLAAQPQEHIALLR